MNSTNASERIRRNKILDEFCKRGMKYDPVNDWEKIDAKLYLEKNDKFIGIAMVVSNNNNFGNSPVVEVNLEKLNFFKELGLLTSKATALIVKFRNKIKYWRVGELGKVPFVNKMSRGRSNTVYQIPIGEFCDP